MPMFAQELVPQLFPSTKEVRIYVLCAGIWLAFLVAAIWFRRWKRNQKK